jgi:lysophospholipase L1-like esterase
MTLLGTNIHRILAWGCSFTWGVGLDRAQPGWGDQASKAAWPQRLADRIGLPVKNLAQPGASNLWIADQIMNYSFKPGDLVLIMWTWPTRTTQGLKDPNPRHILANTRTQLFEHWQRVYTEDDILRQDRILHWAADQQLRSQNIPALSLRVLDPICSWNDLPLALDHGHPGPEWHERMADQIIQMLAVH